MISHAGTIGAMLLAGKPLVVLPMHVEQALSARRVAASGAGVCIAEGVKKLNIRANILEVFSKGKYAKAAKDIARRYCDYDPSTVVVRIVGRCAELLLHTRSPPGECR